MSKFKKGDKVCFKENDGGKFLPPPVIVIPEPAYFNREGKPIYKIGEKTFFGEDSFVPKEKRIAKIVKYRRNKLAELRSQQKQLEKEITMVESEIEQVKKI